MNNSSIIELKEQNAINTDHNNPLGTNGHFNIELNSKNIHINDGDTIGIRSCFLDCVNENTGKIKIDNSNKDITIRNCMYMTAFRTDAQGNRNTFYQQGVGASERGQPNGKIFVLCERLTSAPPASYDTGYILTRARVNLKHTRISSSFGGFSTTFQYCNQKGQENTPIILSFPETSRKFNGGIDHIDAQINGTIFLFGRNPINLSLDFFQTAGPSRDERQKHFNIEGGKIELTFENASVGDSLIPKEFTNTFSLPVGDFTPDLVARMITDNLSNLQDFPANATRTDILNNKLPVITAPAIYQTGADVYKETFPSRSIYGTSTKQLAYDNEFYGMNLTNATNRDLYFVSADGLNIMTFNNAQANKNYFVGSSQLSLEFNPADNKFVFSQLHTSQFNSSQLPIVKYFKDNLDSGFLSTAIGGVFFTDLQPPALWDTALGFDSSVLCNPDSPVARNYMNFDNTTLEFNEIITPSFLSMERGVNITSDLAGIDASVDKVLFTPAGAGSDIVPDLNNFSDDQKEGTAVMNNIQIRASKPFQDIQHLDGYYIIQITGIPSIDMNLTPSQQISAIVSKYYTAGTYLIMEGGAGSFTYTHRGEHFYLQDLNVKIMESDGTNPTKLGNNNTIFLEINRSQNLLQF